MGAFACICLAACGMLPAPTSHRSAALTPPPHPAALTAALTPPLQARTVEIAAQRAAVADLNLTGPAGSLSVAQLTALYAAAGSNATAMATAAELALPLRLQYDLVSWQVGCWHQGAPMHACLVPSGSAPCLAPGQAPVSLLCRDQQASPRHTVASSQLPGLAAALKLPPCH
jgi:hypothetical protein